MKKPLWNFTDNQGSFLSRSAAKLTSLYFPLCNNAPLMASITPDLHGDLKTGYNSFLLEPVSRIGLSNQRSSRNFWVFISPDKIWSATGVSKDIRTTEHDECWLEAGLLWQRATRENKRIGLKAAITSFIPAGDQPVEIMQVTLTNITKRPIRFTPTAAIPLFGRSANNLHDHRHVTSLLNRVTVTKDGVVLTPTLLFDESGHRRTATAYFVFGVDGNSQPPQYIYPTQEEFTGEASDLEAPRAVFENRLPRTDAPIQGKEAMGGLRFKTITLGPRKKHTYIIVMGIANDAARIGRAYKRFNSLSKVTAALRATAGFWREKSARIAAQTPDPLFDNWLRWVGIQPVLRKIFGNSFLPDFDYGKGGRGWRDLWQDCLSLILTNPHDVRPLLVNNFSGIRIDGSNATIIGAKPGEFRADRNNISRVWMDHGIWPLVTTLLYVNQTGDTGIVLEKMPYFRDHQLARGRLRDASWDPAAGQTLKTKKGAIYRGTILEHLLVQTLVQFFNVGPHNHIRLENADWNDGLDMAGRFGESVAFTCMYAKNLSDTAALIRKLDAKKIVLCRELILLLDTLGKQPVNYARAGEKIKRLERYYAAGTPGVSGTTIAVDADRLVADLEKKARWIGAHIQKTEWLGEGFFNGYYDEDKKRLEGTRNGKTMMTLTAQVFAVMSGIATDAQVPVIFKNAKRYLRDPHHGGFRLNTDFGTDRCNMGRAFSFVYGDKENGACFNHMAVMFAYSLYSRGFAREGFEVFDSIFRMATNTPESKIYPCLPEYFNAQGRGMYSYLTGSASWFMLTLLTQAFGIRGDFGDLVLEPKLTRQQFTGKGTLAASCTFAGKHITVVYANPHAKEFGAYRIGSVRINGKTFTDTINRGSCRISRRYLLSRLNQAHNTIAITLE